MLPPAPGWATAGPTGGADATEAVWVVTPFPAAASGHTVVLGNRPLSRRRPVTTTVPSSLSRRPGSGAPIEVLWLAAVVLVPLTFGPPGWLASFDTPKIALMRTLMALMLAAWTVDAALRVVVGGIPAIGGWRGRTLGWLNAYPPRWTLAAAAATALVAAASTLGSAIPLTALWGFEQGGEGRSLLSTASVLALFFAIALRLRSERMAWRLVAAIGFVTVVAAAYIVTQALGMDPFELGRFKAGRLVGSFGNPIFAGAALLMGLPLVLAGSLAAAGPANAGWRGPSIAIAAGAVGGGVTAAAIALTTARGPWVGAAIAMVAFLAMGWRILPARARRRLVALAAASAAVALGLLASIGTPGADDPGSGATDDPRGGGTSLATTLERVASAPAAAGGGFSGRNRIWEGSLRIAVSRPWFAFEEGSPVVVRHLLGYGPDSFPYVYPLGEEPSLRESVTLTRDAHNQYANMLVEQGVLGLIVSLSMTVVPLAAGGYVLVRRSAAYPWRTRLLLLGVLSALAGRAVEQLVGVDKLADSLLSWALLGLLVGLGGHAQPASRTPPASGVAGLRSRLVVAPLAAGTLVLLATVTMAQAVNPLLAAREAVSSDEARARSDGFVALDHMMAASARAPGVARYRLGAVALLDEVRGLDVPPEQRAAVLLSALAVLEEGLDHDRLSPELTQQLASHYLSLAEYDIAEGEPLAIEAFERTAALLPNHWQPKRNLAMVLLGAGRPADALPLLSEVIEMLGDASPVGDIRLLREAVRRDAERIAAGATGGAPTAR